MKTSNLKKATTTKPIKRIGISFSLFLATATQLMAKEGEPPTYPTLGPTPILCRLEDQTKADSILAQQIRQIEKAKEAAVAAAKLAIQCKEFINETWPDNTNNPNLQAAWHDASAAHPESISEDLFSDACDIVGLQYGQSIEDFFPRPLNRVPMRLSQTCGTPSGITLVKQSLPRDDSRCVGREAGEVCYLVTGFKVSTARPIGSINLNISGAAHQDGEGSIYRYDNFLVGASEIPMSRERGAQFLRIHDFSCSLQTIQATSRFQAALDMSNSNLQTPQCATTDMIRLRDSTLAAVSQTYAHFNQSDEVFDPESAECQPYGFASIRNAFAHYSYPGSLNPNFCR